MFASESGAYLKGLIVPPLLKWSGAVLADGPALVSEKDRHSFKCLDVEVRGERGL